MKKKISDFLLDVSKYVFAGLLIAPLFTNTCENGACWWVFSISALAFIVGLFISKQKKGGANKNNNNNRNNNKNFRNKNNNNKNNASQNKA